MGNTPNKEPILTAIINAARLYKKNLVGKTFFYVFEGNFIEVVFHEEEFRHLTGVTTQNLTAKSFFSKAANGTLRQAQIDFDARHPYHLCKRKIKHIQNLSRVINCDVIVLKDISTDTEAYQFGFTELHFDLCLGSDRDIQTKKLKNEYYIVKSLRDGDGFDKAATQYECNYIFCKMNNERLYHTLCYTDGKTSIEDLSEDIRQLLDPSLNFSNKDLTM